jgi:hypothetical protein
MMIKEGGGELRDWRESCGSLLLGWTWMVSIQLRDDSGYLCNLGYYCYI